MEYKKLEDIIEFNPTEILKKGSISKKISMDKLGVFSKYINSFETEKYNGGMKFRNGDTLLARITPCLENGKTSKVTILDEGEVGFGSTEYIVMRHKENISDEDYIFYLAISPKFREIAIKSMSGTSGRQRVQLDVVKNTKMLIPGYKEQTKIGKVLSSFDKKIELNNQINDKLLKLCKYKYDELNNNSDNWSLIRINDLNMEVTDYVANGSFKSLADNVTLYDEKEYALYVRNTDLKVNFLDKRKYVDKKSYEFLKKSKLNGGELIISNVGDVGSVFICPHLDMPMTLGSNVVMIYSTDEHYYNFFLYFFFTSVYGQYMINGITGGSAQPKFNKTDFRNMEIKFPTFDELDRFNKYIKPIYDKYELNLKENEKLVNLRDTLLSKLMNGEIDLDKVEI